MIFIKQLFRALLKPKEAFEELQGQVAVREGFIAWALCLVLGLLPAFLVAKKLGFDRFLIDFGAGMETGIIRLLIYICFGFFTMLATAWLATLTARKEYGGNGTFAETFGMLGYTKAILVIRGLAAALLSLLFWWRTASVAAKVALEGGSVPGNLFSIFVTLAIIITYLFSFWSVWVEARAVSASNRITMPKSMLIVILISIIFWLARWLLP